MNRLSVLLVAFITCVTCAPTRAADWLTYRGSAARTGNVDGQPGPKSPTVLWVHRSREHYVASPVVDGQSLFVSGLGAFNTASFQVLSLDPAASKRVSWSKGPPELKLPVVCAPVVSGGEIIFGDGMHQTSGSVLRAVRASDGFPLWQYVVAGELIHMEGAATVTAGGNSGGRVVIGGGHAGVICVDPSQLELGGKTLTRDQASAAMAEAWKAMAAKYEVDRKKDPDFAVAPSIDALPKPTPKLVWQKGANQWHVDAPVAVAGDKVLIASAFLDKEQSGKRALMCVKLDDGSPLWEAPLAYNPWSGATIAGDTAIVGCGSVGLYINLLAGARGEVLAVNLADGKERWRKSVKGAVVSPIAAVNGLAVFTATDGKVRAFAQDTGMLKWIYDAGAPLFAGPAVAGDVAYTADLRGVVHAINLANGTTLWKLDLTTDPAVKLPAGGKVYGSPIVHGGRLYLATCNLEGGESGQQMAVVCISEK